MQSRQERSWLAILPPLVLVVLIVHVAVIAGGQTWAEPDRVAERTPAHGSEQVCCIVAEDQQGRTQP